MEPGTWFRGNNIAMTCNETVNLKSKSNDLSSLIIWSFDERTCCSKLT